MRIINTDNVPVPTSAEAIIEEAARIEWAVAIIFVEKGKLYPIIDLENREGTIRLQVVALPDYQTQTIRYDYNAWIEIGLNKPIISPSQAIRIAQTVENVSRWPLRESDND